MCRLSLSKGKIKKPKRKPRKGFTRKAKDWEESIATHIGKIIDNLKAEDILNLVTAVSVSYFGYDAAKRVGANDTDALKGSAIGLISYQLAKQPNMAAGASGVVGLASIGVCQFVNPFSSGEYPDIATALDVRTTWRDFLRVIGVIKKEETEMPELMPGQGDVG